MVLIFNLSSSLKRKENKWAGLFFFILLGVVIFYSVNFFVFGLWILKYGDLPIKTVLVQHKNSPIMLMATGIVGFLLVAFFANTYFRKD